MAAKKASTSTVLNSMKAMTEKQTRQAAAEQKPASKTDAMQEAMLKAMMQGQQEAHQPTEEEKKQQQEEEEKAWHNSLVWAAIGGIALVGLVLVKKLRHYVCLLTQNGFARDAYRTDGRDSRKGRRGLTGGQEAEPRVH